MYKIIGGDGNEYGPVSAEQVRQWLAEGRADFQTQVQLAGTADWRPLSAFPELTGAPPPPPSPPPPLPPPVPPVYPTATPGQPRVLPTTHPMAVIGLVLGIVATLQCCSVLFGILGIIFSSIALTQINKRPAEFTGKGMAIAGLVLSIAGVLISTALLAVWWSMLGRVFTDTPRYSL